MIRNDGTYKVYIIKFQFPDEKGKNSEWCYAGDAMQFLPKDLTRDKFKEIKDNESFKDLTACGECWQQTGISGTYNRNHCLNVMMKIAEWNPGYRFRLSEVTITQKTKEIVKVEL